MNTRIAICGLAAILVCLTARGDEVQPDPVIVAETMLEDGSVNTWTRDELEAALGLMNRKYHRDMETRSGREAWHGKLEGEIIDEAAGTKTQVYADGFEYVIPFEPRPQVVERKPAFDKRPVPPALEVARRRREQEKATTNVVNVVITPSGYTIPEED